MCRLFPLIPLLALMGCQLLQSGTQSEWAVLEGASSITCDLWPLRDKDLEVNELLAARDSEGKGRAALATGLGRSGQIIHYFTPFTGSTDIDPDDLMPLKLGRTAVLIGGVQSAQGPLTAVIQRYKDKSTFEIRRVKDNVIRHKTDLSKGEVDDGFLTPVPGGAWIGFMEESRNYKVAWIAIGASGIKSKFMSDVVFPSKPTILPTPDARGMIAVWADEREGTLHARRIGQDGKASASHKLDITIEGGLESWSAASHRRGHYLAYVEGDSLVGQSTLKIAYFDWLNDRPKIQWTRDTPLPDVHLTEPVIVERNDAVEILLLTWVDEEATIARYRVTGAAIELAGYSGIFAKGSRILDAFRGEGGDLFAFVRNKGKMTWEYRVCEL